MCSPVMFSQAMVQFSARNWPMLPDPLHRGVCLRGNEARSHLRLSVPSMFVKPWSNRTQFWLLRIVITTGLMGVRTCVSIATAFYRSTLTVTLTITLSPPLSQSARVQYITLFSTLQECNSCRYSVDHRPLRLRLFY